MIALLLNILFGAVAKDAAKLGKNPQYYVELYDETGEVPEEFRKYCDPKYDKLWKAMNIDGFEEFYGMLIDELDRNSSQTKSGRRSGSSDEREFESSESRSSSGELPVDL